MSATTSTEYGTAPVIPPRFAPRRPRVADVVLIDDNPGDCELVRLAFAECGIPVKLHVAHDGERAFALQQQLAQPPALVLLDLGLPLIRGADILGALRRSGPWTQVPIVVLSSSQSEHDIAACVARGATAYKTKPTQFDGYLAFVQSLTRYL